MCLPQKQSLATHTILHTGLPYGLWVDAGRTRCLYTHCEPSDGLGETVMGVPSGLLAPP